MRKSTIKDVAARAQVSLKTVSRVINDEAGVHERTRARVRQQLGHQLGARMFAGRQVAQRPPLERQARARGANRRPRRSIH